MRRFLTRQVFNVPHLITLAKAQEIMQQVLVPKLEGRAAPELFADEEDDDALEGGEGWRNGYRLTGDGIAIVPVFGTLVHRAGWLDAMSGLTSYQMIVAAQEAALADAEVRGVLLEIDSPGGQGSGAFEHAARLARDRDKPVYAVAADSAYSAGYLIASTADRIYLPETGGVGSVGCVVVHTDMSEYDRKVGLRYTYIAQGRYKAEGNPHERLSEHARAELDALVATCRDVFARTVAANRGLSEQQVRDTESACYTGRDALAIGFADELGGVDAALDGLRRAVGASPNVPTGLPAAGLNNRTENMDPKDKKASVAADAGTGAAAEGQTGQPAATTTAAAPAQPAAAAPAQVLDLDAARTAGASAAAERATKIAELCTTAGCADRIAGFLAGSLSVEQVREQLFNEMAERGVSAGVSAAHGQPQAGKAVVRQGWNNAIRTAAQASGLTVEG